jgi:hypothetical protein
VIGVFHPGLKSDSLSLARPGGYHLKNPYFASRVPLVSDVDQLKVDEVLTQTGLNTGNLLFFSAARRVVKHEKPSAGMSFSPGQVREQHDGIVIPAANWLKPSSDFGGLADLIEKSQLPCIILGLGAQASDTSKLPDLKPGNIRFLKVLSERAKSLSLRGAYTARVLEKYGVHNFNVTGCPSLLWKVGGPVTVNKNDRAVKAVSLNGTRYDTKNVISAPDESSRVGMLIMRLGLARNFDYVAQAEELDMKVARGELRLQPGAPETDHLLAVYGEQSVQRLETYLKQHLKIFGDISAWIEFLSRKEFVIGTRLHGVIAGLLAGVPSVLVTHDSRTSEMAEAAGIPHLSSSSLQKRSDIDIQKIYDSVEFYTFNSKQQSYYSNFREFFEQNGVAHNLSGLVGTEKRREAVLS